jgi:hypothetical protein
MDQSQYNNQQNQFQSNYNNNQFQAPQQPMKPNRKKFKKGLIIFLIPAIFFVLSIITTSMRFVFTDSDKTTTSQQSTQKSDDSSCNGILTEDKTEACVDSGTQSSTKTSSGSTAATVFNLLGVSFGLLWLLSLLPCSIIGIILMTKKD